MYESHFLPQDEYLDRPSAMDSYNDILQMTNLTGQIHSSDIIN